MIKKYKYGIDYGTYSKELIESMYEKRFCGLPISFLLLDLRKTNTYCYQSSMLLSYVLPDAVLISGWDNSIIGENKTHYWIELDNLVLDTTMGLVWNRDKYYALKNIDIGNVKIHSKDEIKKYLGPYLAYTENENEMYIAWIRDMNSHLNEMLYQKLLKDHIERFVKEKKLEQVKYEETLVQAYLKELNSIYQHINEFIQESKKEK